MAEHKIARRKPGWWKLSRIIEINTSRAFIFSKKNYHTKIFRKNKNPARIERDF